MVSAYELNVAYGITDPDDDEDIGTVEERSEALRDAGLPSLRPPTMEFDEPILASPEETAPIVPTGLMRTPSIPRPAAKIQPLGIQPRIPEVELPQPTRGPIFQTAERILRQQPGIIPREVPDEEDEVDRLNRAMGLTELSRPIGETRDTQDPGTPISTIFKNVLTPVEPPKPPPPQKPGLIREALTGIPHGILQVGEIVGGVIGVAGEATGIEAIEKVGDILLDTFHKANQRFAPSVAGIQDVESVGDVARFLGHGFFSMLPFMVGTLGTGAALRLALRKALGRKIAERAAAKAAIGFGSIAAASTIAETGIIAGERTREGMRALGAELMWAIPAGFLDALPQWRLLGKLGWFGRTLAHKAQREGVRAARRYFVKNVGIQGFFEGVTESAQEVFEEMGVGRKPLTYESLMQAANAFIVAAFTGGVLGGAVSLLEPRRPGVAPVTTPIAPPPTVEPTVKPTVEPTVEPIITPPPDTKALWDQTVYREIQEPIPSDEVSRLWRKFFESVPVWRELDVQEDQQVVIHDINGGKLSCKFNPETQEFEPTKYTERDVDTILSKDEPLPNAVIDLVSQNTNLTAGRALVEEPPPHVTEPEVAPEVVRETTPEAIDILKAPVKPRLTKEPPARIPPERLGLVHYNNQQRYFLSFRPITKGKHKGKHAVTLTNGRVVIVDPSAIIRQPAREAVDIAPRLPEDIAVPPVAPPAIPITEVPEAEPVTPEPIPPEVPKRWPRQEVFRVLQKARQGKKLSPKEQEIYDASRPAAIGVQPKPKVKPGIALPRGYTSVEEFTGPNTPLRTSQYAIITAANPHYQQLPDQENIRRNRKLARELRQAGFVAIPVTGHFGDAKPEPGFLVPDMTDEQALEFGKQYEQDSVLTPRGLLYQDGSIQPANLDAIIFDNNRMADYTEITIAGHTLRFFIPIADTKITPTAPPTSRAQVLADEWFKQYSAIPARNVRQRNNLYALLVGKSSSLSQIEREAAELFRAKVRGAGVTAAETPPRPGPTPVAAPASVAEEIVAGKPVNLLEEKKPAPRRRVARPEPLRVEPIIPPPPVLPSLPQGTFEAVIMSDDHNTVSIRPIEYASVPEGVENIPGFIGKVYYDAINDLVYTPEMMTDIRRGRDIKGIERKMVESLPAEGFLRAFRDLLPDDQFHERIREEEQQFAQDAIQPQVRPGMSREAVQKVVDNFSVQLPKDVLSIEIYGVADELPRKVLTRNRITHKTQAVYDRVLNKLYLIANRHVSDQDVLTSMAHELFGHFGFERLFGPKRMNEIVQEVIKLYGRENLAYLYTAYHKVPGSPDGDYTVALEKIAEIAGTRENPGLWKRFVYWFRYHVTRLFGPIHFSEDDIRAYVWRSRILIQQASFQDKVRKYNAFVKSMGSNLWTHGLPIGPLGARFSMREDTSPSHESAADNLAGFWGWIEARRNKDKHFGQKLFKKLGLIEAIGSLPHWISLNHPAFKPTVQVQWDRLDDKNRDRMYLLQDPDTNQGTNPYLDVHQLKDTSGVDPLVVWSDREDIYLQDDTSLQEQAVKLIGRRLTDAEVKAYRGWKKAFDRSIDYAITRLKQLALDFYARTTWFESLKGVIDGSIKIDQVALEGEDAKAFHRAVTKVTERFAEIDKLEAQLRKFNFYAPHVRGRGDYVVRVYDKDPEGNEIPIWVERFDGATQAERARMRLAQQYSDLKVVKTLEPPGSKGGYTITVYGQDADGKEIVLQQERFGSAKHAERAIAELTAQYPGNRVTKTFEPQTTEFIYGGLNVYVMEAFIQKSAERAVKEGELNEEQADVLLRAVFKSISDEIMARGFRQHYIRRKQGNIGGYQEENLRQVFYDYMSGLAGSIAKLDATRKFHDALQEIDKIRQPDVYEYAVRYVTDMLRNQDSLDNKINALKTLPYLWYISMNLRLALTQLFQNGVTAYPILSRIMKELGVKGSAALELSRAMTDLAGTLLPEEATMLQRAYQEGETLAQYIQEIKGDVSRSWAGKYFTKFVDLVSMPFAGMERFNRKSSLLAAFRVARRAGQSETEAYETAKEFVRSTHYAYGLHNFPQLLRDGTPFSKILGLGYVFKSFPHNYILSMIHYARDKDGKLALDVLMRSLAVLTIMGGIGAAPFIDDILDELERRTGYPARSVIRKSLDRVGGPLLSAVGMEGILALVGLDMSGTTKIQVPIPGVGEYDPGMLMMGVYGGLVDKGKNAISFAANNQWMRAIESAAPSGIESALKSYRLATEGLRTVSGKPIVDEHGRPIVATPYETLVGLAGFRPQRISAVQKERRVAQNIKDRYAQKRKNIMKKWRLAATPEERQEIFKEIQSYNLAVMKYHDVIPRINVASIKQAMKPERGYMTYRRLYED